jgi:DNA-binding LacI/PurR family transcriptional regulator
MHGEEENLQCGDLCKHMIDAIHDKKLAGKLPGKLKLAMKFKTNPFCVKQALKELIQLDLIEERSNKSLYVKYKGRLAVLFMNRHVQSEHQAHSQSVYSPLLKGIEDYVEKCGIKTQVHLISPSQREFIDLLKHEVDAFIVVTALNIREEDFSVFKGYPWVRAMGNPNAVTPVSHITYDNDAVGGIAADYLLKKGCRRFVFFGSANNSLFFARLKNFQARVAEVGGYSSEHIEVDVNIMDQAEIMRRGVKAFAPMVNCGDPVGIFMSADIYASSVYQALHSLGFKPMTNIQIVSCDNSEAYLQNLSSRPPSIEVKMYEIGNRAAEMAIDHPHSQDRIVLTPELKF